MLLAGIGQHWERNSLGTSCSAGFGAHLAAGASNNLVLAVLGVGVDLNAGLAAGGAHGEGPYLGGVVVADLLLLSIEPHSLANQVLAALAPHVEGHLEPDDQNALIKLLGPLSQRMLALLLQQQVLKFTLDSSNKYLSHVGPTSHETRHLLTAQQLVRCGGQAATTLCTAQMTLDPSRLEVALHSLKLWTRPSSCIQAHPCTWCCCCLVYEWLQGGTLYQCSISFQTVEIAQHEKLGFSRTPC